MSDAREKLLELAERCEQASGPDGNLDAAISHDVVTVDWEKHDPRWDEYLWPAYSASLDAAMTLVPAGHRQPSDVVREALSSLGRAFHLHTSWWPVITPYGEFLARYVTAAALRARAAQDHP